MRGVHAVLNWALFCLYFACGLASISVGDRHAQEVARIERREQARMAQWRASGSHGAIFTSNHNSRSDWLARVGMVLKVIASAVAIYMLYCAWQGQSTLGRAVVVGVGLVVLFGRFSVRYVRTMVTIFLVMNLAFAVYLVFVGVL